MRFNQPLFFFVLLTLVAAARLCHVEILWAEETLPLAAAEQVLHGKTLYRDVWFDKPPLVAAVNLLWGARDSWPLRLAGALYQLLACWLAFRFARDLWSPAEGYWAAGLVGFFLTFDFPSAVIPLASDLLLVVPHLAAVWLAWKRRPFASGLCLGVGFLISPKALFVAAVCAIWYPSGVFLMAAGFLVAAPSALALPARDRFGLGGAAGSSIAGTRAGARIEAARFGRFCVTASGRRGNDDAGASSWPRSRRGRSRRFWMTPSSGDSGRSRYKAWGRPLSESPR